MDRTGKEALILDLRERISRAPVLYLTDFTGLNVKAMTELRRSLKKSGAEYFVVKNRLAKRVFQESEDLPDISDSLIGPTGFVLGYEDVARAAKAVSDFAKTHDKKPVFKLGIMDGKVLQPEQVERIARLPAREQLLAELAGALEAPMAAFALVLEAKVQEMAGLLDALREEREKAG
jgi:large subunit ribosomal protein L10